MKEEEGRMQRRKGEKRVFEKNYKVYHWRETFILDPKIGHIT